MTQETQPVKPAEEPQVPPVAAPQKPTRGQIPFDPFMAALEQATSGMQAKTLARKLATELEAVRISSVEDLLNADLAVIRRALAAALRLDAHAIVDAAAKAVSAGE